MDIVSSSLQTLHDSTHHSTLQNKIVIFNPTQTCLYFIENYFILQANWCLYLPRAIICSCYDIQLHFNYTLINIKF
jgi:hypothetical protein